jgi:hypothetical protein
VPAITPAKANMRFSGVSAASRYSKLPMVFGGAR